MFEDEILEWMRQDENAELFEKMHQEISSLIREKHRILPTYMKYFAFKVLLDFAHDSREILLNEYVKWERVI